MSDGDTCDECKSYDLMTGWCEKLKMLRRLCGEDACEHFVLADDLAEMSLD